jgi:hypothetical protein
VLIEPQGLRLQLRDGAASKGLGNSCCSSNKNFRAPVGKLDETELQQWRI